MAVLRDDSHFFFAIGHMEISFGDIRANNQHWVLQEEIIASPCHPDPYLSSFLGFPSPLPTARSACSHNYWSWAIELKSCWNLGTYLLADLPTFPAQRKLRFGGSVKNFMAGLPSETKLKP